MAVRSGSPVAASAKRRRVDRETEEVLFVLSEDEADAGADRLEPRAPVAPLRFTTMPHQTKGIAFVARRLRECAGCILGDEMGLGKTYQAVRAIEECEEQMREQGGAILLTVPVTTVAGWRRTIAAVFGDRASTLYYHGPRRREDLKAFLADDSLHFVIASHAAPAADVAQRAKRRAPGSDLYDHRFALLLVDEAHVLRNVSTKNFGAHYALRRHRTLLLTGTPFNNSVVDLTALCMLMRVRAPAARSDVRGRTRCTEERWLRRFAIHWETRRDASVVASPFDPNVTPVATLQPRLARHLRIVMAMRGRDATLDELGRDFEKLRDVVRDATAGDRMREDELERLTVFLRELEDAKECDRPSLLLRHLFGYGGEGWAELHTRRGGRGGEEVDALYRVVLRHFVAHHWDLFWRCSQLAKKPETRSSFRAEKRRILGSLLLRRTKDEVPELRDALPPMEVVDVRVPMRPSDVETHEAWKEAFLSAEARNRELVARGGAGEDNGELLAILQQWRLTSVSSALISRGHEGMRRAGGAGQPGAPRYGLREKLLDRWRSGDCGDFDAHRFVDPETPKFKYLMRELRGARGARRRVLVMSEWTTPLYMLRELATNAAIRVEVIDGKMSMEQRNAIIDAFQSEAGETVALLCSLGACRTGITLTRASTVYFLAPTWNPFGDEKQAMMRLHRIGQDKQTRAVYLMSELPTGDSIDHYVRALQDSKLVGAKGLLGDNILTLSSEMRRSAAYRHGNKMARLRMFIEGDADAAEDA